MDSFFIAKKLLTSEIATTSNQSKIRFSHKIRYFFVVSIHREPFLLHHSNLTFKIIVSLLSYHQMGQHKYSPCYSEYKEYKDLSVSGRLITIEKSVKKLLLLVSKNFFPSKSSTLLYGTAAWILLKH